MRRRVRVAGRRCLAKTGYGPSGNIAREDAAAEAPPGFDGDAAAEAPSGFDGDAGPTSDAPDAIGDAIGDSLGWVDGAEDGADSDGSVTDGCPPPPYDTVTNCGACGVSCSGSTSACKATSTGAFACASPCTAPEIWCGACVDTDLDPLNCGACGKVCTSGLCNGGKCRGAKAGHVALVGHDYSGSSPTAAATKLVSNAVFLPTGSPVRVLAYDAHADPVAVTNVIAVLDAASKTSGRTYTRTNVSTSTDLASKLNIDDFDLVLIYDQSKAAAGALATEGGSLLTTLTSFTQSGGSVVILDGGGGTGEMPKFLTAAGLLDVSGHTSVTGSSAVVVAPTDALGTDVITPYYATAKSTSFTTSAAPSPTAVIVVQDEKSTAPVVIHRVVKKP